MAGKKHKSGVQPFSWEIDDEPKTAAPVAEPPKKSRKKAGDQAPAVEEPVKKTSARKTAVARSGPEPTLETMIPVVGEKFPDILEPKGELSEIGKGMATTIGFQPSYASARRMVALAMFHSKLGRGYKTVEDFEAKNGKDVTAMLNIVNEQLQSPEFQFYQNSMKIPVYVDTTIIKFANKGAMGFIFYGMRSGKATNDGLKAYDLVSKIEDIALNVGVAANIYNMKRAHDLYQEELAETAGDIITNPAMRQQLLLTGYSVALPVIADALEAPSMGEYFNEHYLKHVKNFLNVKEGDTGFVAGMVNTIEGYLLASANDAANSAKKTLDALKDKEHPLANDVARILKTEVADVSKFTAAAARSSELLLFSNPLTTIHMGNAIIYDLTELTLQARFAGKHLEGGKLQSLYQGDR